MIHGQATKRVSLVAPISVTSQTTISATVSLVGWDYGVVAVHCATSSNAVGTMQLSEGDTTSTFATATDMAMTTAAGNTNSAGYYIWYLDLRKRKKLLKIEVMAAVAAQIMAADITLSRGEQAPTTAAEMGATTGRVIA